MTLPRRFSIGVSGMASSVRPAVSILSRQALTSSVVFGLMGAARGLDEGLIGTSASQKSFIRLFGLEDPALSAKEQADLLSNITSMVQLGSIGGALFAFFVVDKIGRLWATRQLCVLWVVGIAIFLAASTNGSIGMVYAGRCESKHMPQMN